MQKIKQEIQESKEWNHKCLLVYTFHIYMSKNSIDKWTLERTSRELNLSIGYVSESIKLVEHFVSDNLDECKTRDEALRKIRK